MYRNKRFSPDLLTNIMELVDFDEFLRLRTVTRNFDIAANRILNCKV